MAKAFRLGDYLKPDDVSNLNTERIEYIDLSRIDPDPDNFYSLAGIEDLAENIELVGLLDPPRVRPCGGRYVVVSGHRRRAACMMIRDGGNPMFDKGVPCIVERGSADDDWRRLRLIFANSHTRVLSPAEISRQADEVLKLLTKLKASGVELPGRMREHVAEALNVSASKLGRVQAIRRNLVPELLALYDSGKINEAVAYRISQEAAVIQRDLAGYPEKLLLNLTQQTVDGMFDTIKARRRPVPSSVITGSRDTDSTSSAAAAAPSPQGEGKDGPPRASAPTGSGAFDPDAYLRERAEEDAEYRERLLKTADRLLDHLAGVCTRQDGIDILKRKLGALRAGWAISEVYVNCEPRGLRLLKRVTANSFSDILRTWTEAYDILCTIAINSHKEMPRPVEAELCEFEPAFASGTPPRDGRYLCRVDLGLNGPTEELCEYINGEWTAYGRPVSDVGQVVEWYPLPEK